MALNKIIADRYEVLESLGSGGFGSVVKVKDRTTREILALKHLSSQQIGMDQVRRFQREFRLLSKLQHPHIVSVVETGTDGDDIYFTMEYLQGFTLEQVLKSPDSPLCIALRNGSELLRKILVQVCEALAVIHAQGLVHRDLKPANLFLQSTETGPSVKILDLGMAKYREEGQEAQTEEGIMLGTVHYMSPEQIRGVHVEARADLYTLGVILYEILAGRKPFEGRNSAAVILKHLNEVPVPPRVYNLDISHDLQLIVLKLLEKEPERRYRSAEDLLADLIGPKTPPSTSDPGLRPNLLLHTRFLGRREEMAEARTLLADVQRSTGRSLRISGEPGIGKTRFLEEFKADAALQSVWTLSGACFADRTAPFQPIVESIRTAEKSLGPLAAWIRDRDRIELARIFPELAETDHEPPSSALRQEDRTVLFEALWHLFEDLTQRTPLMLCLDDLQWADRATLDFLGFLCNRISTHPLMLCLTHRPMETPPQWFEKIKPLPLSPLSESGIGNLLASMFGTLSVPDDLPANIYGLSGGNPFFAIEATKALVASGAVLWETNRWVYKDVEPALPTQIASVLSQRLDILSKEDQDILACASIINRPFSFDLIFAVQKGDEDPFFARTERLVLQRFLNKDRQDRYTLIHNLIAETLRNRLPSEQQRALHRDIGHALAQQLESAQSPAEIAHHLLEANLQQEAVPYLVKAGDQALQTYAYLDARETYEKALSIIELSDEPAPEIYHDLLCNYVDTLRWTGKWDDVQKYAEMGLEQKNLSCLHRARYYLNRGTALEIKGNHVEAEQHFLQVLKQNEQIKEKKIQLQAIVNLSHLYASTGQYAEATHYVESAVSLCQKFGDDFHKAVSSYLLANDHLTNSRFTEAETAFQTALEAFKTIHDERYIHMCQSSLREVYTYKGRFEEAEVLSKKAIDACLKMGSQNAQAYETLDLGYIYAEQNKIDQAESCYFSSHDTLLKSNQRQKLPLAYTRLSELCLKKRDYQKALKLALQAEEILGPEPIRHCQVYRALGMAHAANNASEKAAIYFDKSINALENLGGIQFALTLYESGKFHISTGNVSLAEDQLGRAVELFEQMGADHFLKKAQQVWRDKVAPLDKIPNRLSEAQRSEGINTLATRKKLLRDSPPNPPETAAKEPSPERNGTQTGSQYLPTTTSQIEALPLNFDTNQLLNEAIDRLLKMTGADRGMILTVQDGEPRIQTACSRQLDETSIADISMSVVQAAIEAATLIVTADATNDPRFHASQSIAEHNIGSILCLPLKARDNSVIGAVYADNVGTKFFSPKDVEAFKSFGEFVAVALENALCYHNLQADLEKLAGFRTRFGDLVGTSAAMQTVYDLIERLANTDVTLLLQGETGTGKGLVARTIHTWSRRSDKPFLLQNCGALPRELLETELFGHCKGAFTGATADRQGIFEAANGGTVFLDEIGDAPPEVQVHLLHVLEEGTIRRVGENQMRKVNVRVIAATNRDLAAEVQANRFRQDLYYRLKVMTIAIPPLRERPEDITLLANHFLKFWSESMGKKPAGFTPEVQRAFLRHTWPGNIRELENEIQRGVALVAEQEQIGMEHLSDAIARQPNAQASIPAPTGKLKTEVEQYEQALLIAALKKNGWNITQTAQALGLSRVGMQKKLKKYGIERPKE